MKYLFTIWVLTVSFGTMANTGENTTGDITATDCSTANVNADTVTGERERPRQLPSASSADVTGQ